MTLTWTRLLLLGTIVLVCVPMLALGEDDQHQVPMSTGLLIWDGDQLGRLDLRRPVKASGVVTCAVTPLSRAGTRLTASSGSRPVASFIEGVSGAMFPMYPSALRLGDGRWAIIADSFGGGTYFLQLVVVRANIIAAESQGSSTPSAQPKLFDDIKVPDAAEDGAFFNLTYPALIEHDGRLYIVTSAGFLWNRPPMVAIAAADTYGEHSSLSGRIVGQGFCPRVVKLGSEFVCAVRYADLHPTARNDPATPIRLYRSTDLETWAPMSSPDETLRVSGFDLGVDGNALCLLAVVDVEGEAPAVRFLRFDAATQQWNVEGEPIPAPSRGVQVRLLPPGGDRPGPLAIIPDGPDGLRAVPVGTGGKAASQPASRPATTQPASRPTSQPAGEAK